MKMRDVIEAGRKASPLVNEGLDEMSSRLNSFRQLFDDLSSVKRDVAMDSLIAECSYMAGRIAEALSNTISRWNEFESCLSAYKYKFGRVKITSAKDLPGQQFLFERASSAESRKDEKESRS